MVQLPDFHRVADKQANVVQLLLCDHAPAGLYSRRREVDSDTLDVRSHRAEIPQKLPIATADIEHFPPLADGDELGHKRKIEIDGGQTAANPNGRAVADNVPAIESLFAEQPLQIV